MVSREMEKKNMVDVSCFFLFEASGDSEGGLDPVLPEMGSSVSSDMDAESCCDDDDDSETGYGDGDDGEKGRFEERENEDEMVNPYQRWCEEEEEDREKKPNTKPSASGCLSRDNEFLNEMEKSKLFWEACLAS